MKKTILAFILAITAGCSNDSQNTSSKLPPETQIGANTFGVTINGVVYIPRDYSGFTTGLAGHGMMFMGLYPETWKEIVIVDGASDFGFKMIIHFKDLVNQGVGTYQLKQSNFQDNIDSAPVDHIYFKIWDSEIGNYVYYGSVENQGEIKVTKFDGNFNTDWILSGTFKGKFARYNAPTDIIEITDGRFDLNLNTLNSHVFP